MKRTFTILAVLVAMVSPSTAQEQTIDQKLDYIIQELEALKEAVAALSSEAEPVTPTLEDVLGAIVSTTLDDMNLDADGSDVEELVSTAEPEQTLPLAILSWSAEEPDGMYMALTPVRITLEIQNVSTNDIAILDGSVNFSDRLGSDIGRLRLPRDINLTAGTSVTHTGVYDGDGMFGESGLKRLIEINPDFVDIELDLDEVLFTDGTSVSYD